MRSPFRRGFTLLELLVSLLLVALILALAVGLLREVQWTFLRTGREMVEPIPQMVAQLLRHDVRAARRVADPDPWGGPGGPVDLVLPDGSRVRYEVLDGALVRTLFDPAGEEVGGRSLLPRVAIWRWLELTPGLVEFEIGYPRVRQSPTRRPGPARLRQGTPYLQSIHLRLALRARIRRSW